MERQITGKGSILPVKDKQGKIVPRKWHVRLRYFDNERYLKWTPQKTVRGNKSDAQKVLEDLRHEYEAKLNSCGTVAEYARSFHERRKALGQLAPATIRKDEQEIRRIEENFADILLEELTPEQIIDIYIKLRNQGCSESIMFRLHAKLNQVLKDAQKMRKIKFNPCSAVDRIKRPKAKERKALPLPMAKRLINLIETEPLDGYRVAVYLAIMTGIRRSEAMGLMWCNIDFEKGILNIDHQYDRDTKSKVTKTPKSTRLIPVGVQTLNLLMQWKAQQSESIFDGEEVPNNYPICSNPFPTTNPNTSYISYTSFSAWRIKFFMENHITHEMDGEEVVFEFHELRHTHATLQVAGGTDVITLQNRLGHVDVNTTLKIYSHVVSENERKAASTIENLLI